MSASRVPAGIPTGGQFATTSRGEAENVRLSVVPDRPVTPLDDPNVVECPSCSGSGEVDTGRREQETGAPVTTPCGFCSSTGETTRAEADEYAEQRQEEQGGAGSSSWAAGIGRDPFLTGP